MMLRFLVLCLLAAPAYAGQGPVVTTIKPLHSLAAAVMEGSGEEPLLLVNGASSPHTFSLRPSQMQAISQADVVV